MTIDLNLVNHVNHVISFLLYVFIGLKMGFYNAFKGCKEGAGTQIVEVF